MKSTWPEIPVGESVDSLTIGFRCAFHAHPPPGPWLEPPKSTRAWEPPLLWNHYTPSKILLYICIPEAWFVGVIVTW